jgi:hypothetical protein
VPIFERRDIYYYKDAKVIKTYDKQNILKSEIEFAGSFSGLSAIAFEYPEVSRYIPVLAVEDNYSRNAGFACGVLINYAGEFKTATGFCSGLIRLDFIKARIF